MVPRHLVFDPDTVGIYHLFTRCIRKMFLMGHDRLTDQQHHHRRDAAIDDLKFLVLHFAIDILDFCIMENHLHLLVRNRPDIAAGWSRKEVVLRWWYLFPKRRNKDGSPAEPTRADLHEWLSDLDTVEEFRCRLSNISWLMWRWLGKIAKTANAEDKTEGHFFAGRFKCKRMEDLGAVLACSMYVTLNPVRADMVEAPENYAHSSLALRVAGEMQRHQRELGLEVPTEDPDAWLAELFLDERAEAYNAQVQQVDGQEQLVPQSNPFGAPRPSDKGYVVMKLAQYLRLAHWTADNVRARDRGFIRDSLPTPEFEADLARFGIPKDRWLDLVMQFDKLFGYYIGRPEQMAAAAEKRALSWLKGKRNAAIYLGRFPDPDDAAPDAPDTDAHSGRQTPEPSTRQVVLEETPTASKPTDQASEEPRT